MVALQPAPDVTRRRRASGSSSGGGSGKLAGTAAQFRRRGVRARGDAALARRDRCRRRAGERRGLLQAVTCAHLLGHHLAVRQGRAGRLRYRSRGAAREPACSTHPADLRPSSPCRQTPRRSQARADMPRIVQEHALAPASDRRRPRDRRDRLRGPDRRRRRARPGRGHGVRCRPTAHLGLRCAR